MNGIVSPLTHLGKGTEPDIRGFHSPLFQTFEGLIVVQVRTPYPSTFSCVARDPDNGDLGVIVQSKFPCVGSIVQWAKAEVGAVATQAWANPVYGPRGLELMAEGKSATETLKTLQKEDDEEMVKHRQVGLVDAKGEAVSFTGNECMDWAGHVIGNGFCCQGNILAGESVVTAMAGAYESTDGDIIDRLFATLKAGQSQGGDRRGMQSAAILVVRKGGGYGGEIDRYVDVRVDDHPSPIVELERIFDVYDMTLLSREDPSRLLKIEGTTAIKIQKGLKALGFLESVTEDSFPQRAAEALRQFINENNFENKATEDSTIWQSVYEYLLHQANM